MVLFGTSVAVVLTKYCKPWGTYAYATVYFRFPPFAGPYPDQESPYYDANSQLMQISFTG
ncbi:hypothetical protein B0H17DRAFT_1068513 [Mycena rosella]|uniref:Uncharacterized protein n=1 Tax=Mycena rosella TaxID=1033263 RepID=A0AAD7DCG5_MYCRO|nr:hypothetical protein B0H17DRAFT_1068513 [Mycena rosella]